MADPCVEHEGGVIHIEGEEQPLVLFAEGARVLQGPMVQVQLKPGRRVLPASVGGLPGRGEIR